ncbi:MULTISPECIES: AmpG family muropeptide MFS transporter [Cyanophyceae]|uniref:AmpG family muropeptide MFS transporter n=1 Tax=Cyanophyceae TaxID=3028117 RepID=UPI00232DD1F9|nr:MULTISPECIES: AmpG family muropeptide MFS transporter [Cyanophyceae]MDB9320067.1 AmpG family muropeptide MFS transporter [Nodularia spumigena CS-590/01A]MDB9322741.1 AmpG family muropeptide MFS transporter [Nodularia spumigena CS-591/07A]MDB9327502.1 AmpG family muropeptide MFS transporter [Nodularia spumigena CS-590/02]MDB9330040.1 AmpG family muropeptide MFS transporter [Nodularia spumigena CS-591/04]MDB9333556.1 AmpG family muropeptide MFS transporter [Nodularia spumigena CS-590/01]
MKHPTTPRTPWTFIPTLYFASGIPYIIINTVSVIFYKNLGIDNTQIALWTSFLYLPWVIKMFWGPVVDIYSTKRRWILCTQLAMFGCLILVAFSLQLSNFFFPSFAALTIGAFISATYDIATDGFYLLALTPEQQAFFVGIRSLFYRLAVIFCSGVLVVLAGQFEVSLHNIPLSWTIAIGFSALILGILFIFHRLVLPLPESDNQRQLQATNKIPFWEIIKSYFAQEKIFAILAFILLYRLGEAMLVKIASLFLLDQPEVGGLGLTTSEVGLVYGTFGVISLICGGILGGLLISKYGLERCLLPMALALNLPDLFYVYMAYTKPSLTLVYPLVSLEQFGYGVGFTAFSVYLMYISQGEYKTSHFAISTGFMALGMMLPGLVSGYLQQSLGYPLFFVLVCLLTIPGMISLFFLPLKSQSPQKLPFS